MPVLTHPHLIPLDDGLLGCGGLDCFNASGERIKDNLRGLFFVEKFATERLYGAKLWCDEFVSVKSTVHVANSNKNLPWL
mgnify:CR=1 FL=1